jgi:hypothetical protein
MLFLAGHFLDLKSEQGMCKDVAIYASGGSATATPSNLSRLKDSLPEKY